MKTKMVYICEHCKNEYKSAEDALKCEAKHLGLTLEEYKKYLALLETEKRCGFNVGIAKNERTDKLWDDAIKEVIRFQKEHNLSDNK